MKKLRILAILVMLEIVLVMATSFSHPGAAFQDLKLVSVEFKEVDLRDLRILSAKTGVNIIASPEVEGKVTARFERPIPFLKALKIILEANNCRYERVDNVIKVSKIPLFTKSFSLRFALAEEVSEELSPLLSKEGKIKVNKEANTLAITDTEERIKQAEETISRIDTPDRQLDTKIFSLKFTRAEELSSLLKANLTNVGSIKVDPSTNSLLITDVRYNLSKLAEIISRLDVFKPATQVFSPRFALAEKMAKLVEGYLSPEEKVEVNKEKNELIVTATVHNLERIESFIRSRDTLERQMSEQHFLIKYVKMDEVLPLVEDALSSGGRLKVDPSRSILSVNDASYNLYKIERIIKAADVFNRIRGNLRLRKRQEHLSSRM